jgi:O-antigen/teichoic acid export membrane protein
MTADAPSPDAPLRATVLRGSLSNYAGRFLSRGLWFLLTPFVLGELGPAGFGLWVLVGSLAAYGYLLDLGIVNAVVKYLAEFEAQGRRADAQVLITSALWAYAALAVVAVVLGLVGAALLPDAFGIGSTERDVAAAVVLLTGISVALTIAFTPVTAVLQGLQRYDLYNLVTVTASLLTALGTVLVLLAGGGIIGVVAVNIPVTIVVRLWAARLAGRLAPWLRFSLGRPSRRMLRTIMSFSWTSFGIQLAGPLKAKTDEVVIGAALVLSAVTPYNLARRLSEIPLLLTEPFLKILIPLVSGLSARGSEATVRDVYLTASRITLAVLFPVALVIAVLAEPILRVWVGTVAPESQALVVLLVLSGVLNTSQYAGGSVLQGLARHRWIAVAAIASGLANLALSVILVERIGLIGVAIGTLIPTAIESLAVVLPYCMRELRVSLGDLVRQVWLPTIVPAAGAAALLLVLRTVVAPEGLVPVVVSALTVAGVFVAGYTRFAVTAPERRAAAWALSAGTTAARSRLARG